MKRTNPKNIIDRSGIYLIECKANGRVYIGGAKKLNQRLNYHRWAMRNNKHPNKHLQHDTKRFGIENFSFKILVFCSIKLLDFMEQKAFEAYECNDRILGYNIWTAGKKNRKPNNELKNKFYQQGKNSLMTKTLSRMVIDIKSGKIYQSIGDASKDCKIPFRTLCRWLKFESKNKSSMRYYAGRA